MMVGPVISVREASVTFPTPGGPASAIQDVSFDVYPGETLGIVGESGSGKTVTALTMMGLVPRPGRVVGGSVVLEGKELIGASGDLLREVRGSKMGMVFQEPMTSLHPTLKVGYQIAEAIQIHDSSISDRQALSRVVGLLESVGIPGAAEKADELPHTWSGGMRQRAMIAMAIANRPKLLIADEPTTALDVTIQAQILDTLRAARDETGASLILISHDLGVIAQMADRVLVMYAGRVVESGPVGQIFHGPQHPYTAGLLESIPSLSGPIGVLPSLPGRPPNIANLPAGCSFSPRCSLAQPRCSEAIPLIGGEGESHSAACFFSELVAPIANRATVSLTAKRDPDAGAPLLEVEHLVVDYTTSKGLFGRNQTRLRAVDGVSFAIREGETLGLVGESGCGKTTTARAILRLVEPTEGSILFRGDDIASLKRAPMQRVRRDIQAVFQDPFGSLNPRMSISDIIASPLRIHGELSRGDTDTRVGDLLNLVGLGHELTDRLPAALSGGQRQRVGIARALALEPALLILDEPLSALDVSIQAQILNLLRDLQEELGLSYLLIGHDLAAVRHLATRVAVMYLGRIVESGPRDEIYSDPSHPYTKALLSAVPQPDPGSQSNQIVLVGDVPSNRYPISGCRFASRCYRVEGACLEVEPELIGSAHACACFFPLNDLPLVKV